MGSDLEQETSTKPIWHIYWIEAYANGYDSAEKAAIMAITPTNDWVFYIPPEFWREMGLEILEAIGKIPGLPNLYEWGTSGAVISHKIAILCDPEATEEQKGRALFDIMMEATSLAVHEAGLKFLTYLCSKSFTLYELYINKGIPPPPYHNGAEISLQNGVDSSPKAEIEFHSPVSVVIRTPQGYFIGRDPRLGYSFNDMSLTTTYDDKSNHPFFNMNDVIDGVYIMRIVGIETSPYSFDVTLKTLDKRLFTQHFTGTITPGEMQMAMLKINSTNPDTPIFCIFASNNGDDPDFKPKADAGDFYVAKNGDSFMLDASASVAFDSSTVSYEWDLDDDGVFDVTSASPTLTYSRTVDEPVTLRLRVTDEYGLSDNASLLVVSSIQEAIDLAEPGSVAHVEPGLYQENLIISKPVRLIGADSITTIIDGQTLDSTIRIQADYVEIRGFTVTGSNSTFLSAGILIEERRNIAIVNNIIWNNQGSGITSMWSQRIKISNNIIVSNNQEGISIHGFDSQALIYDNYIEDNMQDGILMYAADSINIESNIVSNNGAHGISASGGSQDITIRGNTVTENLFNGIVFGFASNITVEYNRVSGNLANGISPQDETEKITIRYNILENNGIDGIYTFHSQDNAIVSNLFVSNQRFGIYLDSGNRNTVLHNIFNRNGLYVRYSYGNIVTNNTVNGKLLVYIEGAQNITIDNAGQVILVECSNMTVKNIDLSNVGVGLELWRTNYTTITGNNFTMNRVGIMLLNSKGNIIYHNNFASNSRGDVYFPAYGQTLPNIWDNGYPSGGNCWSNYTGSDVYHGVYQNILGSDGIGDTPQILASDNVDNYPIVENYAQPNVINVTINGAESTSAISSDVIITDLTQTPQGLNFTVIGFPGELARVLLTLPGPCTYGVNITIDSVPLKPPYPIITNNVTHYFVYFEVF